MLSSIWVALNPKNKVSKKLFNFDVHILLWNAIQLLKYVGRSL